MFSAGVHGTYDKLEDLGLKLNYTLTNAANAGGFYNDLAFDQLSREFAVAAGVEQRVSFIHAAPGFVRTAWGKDFPFPLNTAISLLQRFAMTPEQCADKLVGHALLGAQMGPPALSLDTKNSVNAGFHLMTPDGKEAARTKLHSDKYREAVWAHTNELLKNALKS